MTHHEASDLRATRPTRTSSIKSRVVAGAFSGMAIAAVGLVIGAARLGLAIFAGRRFHFGLSDTLTLLSYPIGFALGGAVVGALYPMRRRWIGAILLGVIGAAVFFASVFVASKGSPTHWTSKIWLVLGLSSLILGSIAAPQFKKDR